MPQGLANLPNLGALALRSCVAKTGTNPNPNPKRQKTSGAQNAEVAAQAVEDFINKRVAQYLGRTPTDQEKQDLIERARREVARMYAAYGLTYDWPNAIGVTEGQALLEGAAGCDASVRYHENRGDFSVDRSSRVRLAVAAGRLAGHGPERRQRRVERLVRNTAQ